MLGVANQDTVNHDVTVFAICVSFYTRVAISQVFRMAARAAGLKDFRFHDLRHHGAAMALNQDSPRGS